MGRKWGRIMDRWGHYFLAILCAGVILFSALWTRTIQDAEIQDARALSDQSQQLQEAQDVQDGLSWPTDGEILAGFHLDAAFYPRLSLWHIHPGIDFAAAPGTEIFCMASGQVIQTKEMIEIIQENGDICRYFGAAECLVSAGQMVRAGERIGISGAPVHFEREKDRICVMLIREGKNMDFSGELIEKKTK